MTLASEFSLVNLDIGYLNEIHALITDHYIEDNQQIFRMIYSKDYLYWYFNHIPSQYIIGLIYHSKLVGLISAMPLDMVIHNEKMSVSYVNFLCIQKKLRKMGLAKLLINELQSRLGDTSIIYTGIHAVNASPLCSVSSYIIPINYAKLHKIEFINEDDIGSRPIIDDNPLHLMKQNHVSDITIKLNSHYSNYQVRPNFTGDMCHHFFLPKKNVVYSFVVVDGAHVTDFVSVTKNYMYCIEKNKVISIGHLSFYYNETLSITELIMYLIAKLPSYGIDQLMIRDIGNNSNIDITKFCTDEMTYYYSRSMPGLCSCHAKDFYMFPF